MGAMYFILNSRFHEKRFIKNTFFHEFSFYDDEQLTGKKVKDKCYVSYFQYA